MTSVLTISRGAHWNVPRDKLERVGNAYGACVDYYFPDTIGEVSLIGAAGIATAGAFGPPLVVDALRAQAAARNRPRPQPQPQPQPYYVPPQPAAPPGWNPVPDFGQTPQPPAPAYAGNPAPADLPNMTEADFALAMQQAAAIVQSLMQPQPDTEEPTQ